MKINFDQLFKEDSTSQIDPQILNSTLVLQTNHKTEHLNSTMQTQDITNFTRRQREVQDYESVKRVLDLKLALALHDVYRDEEVSEPVIQILKRKNVNVAQLSNKMYRHEGCSKQECLQYKVEKQQKEKEEEGQLDKNHSFISPKNSKKDDSQSISAITCNKLYNLALLKEQRRLDTINMFEKQRIKQMNKTGYRKTKYLKNYVSFYERLDDEIHRSNEKYKALAEYSTFIEGRDQKYFKPTLTSKKYRNIPSRYDKPSTQGDKHSYLDDIHSSLNTSLMSVMSLDKSIQMVSSIEQYFFSKMVCIFIDQNQEYVEVTPSKIDFLSDCEFKIIQNFIKIVEETGVKCEQFQSKLRNFYNDLSFNEKQQLRTHERKAKKREKQQKTLKKGIQSCSKLQGNASTKSVKIKGQKYLQAMSDFV